MVRRSAQRTARQGVLKVKFPEKWDTITGHLVLLPLFLAKGNENDVNTATNLSGNSFFRSVLCFVCVIPIFFTRMNSGVRNTCKHYHTVSGFFGPIRLSGRCPLCLRQSRALNISRTILLKVWEGKGAVSFCYVTWAQELVYLLDSCNFKWSWTYSSAMLI